MSRILLGLLLLLPAAPALAQRRNEQFHLPGSFNWRFLKNYPDAARLFNAFDYGHAILYERLWSDPARAPQLLAGDFRFLTEDLLVRPPRFGLAEEAVMSHYSRLVWRAKQMFDWAHALHRQIYDVYADERISPEAKPALVERITDYYLSNRELAFSTAPKSMALMDEAYYSQVFRRSYPQFNGLIWAYHWLQVGLYEPLIGAKSDQERGTAVQATLARFREMIATAGPHYPELMPMTPAVAPTFTARHPRAAAIFDNLHMMHDIISDILVSDRVSRSDKARAINQALAEFRDGSRNIMSESEWREMADAMGGASKMGGVAWTPPIP